MNAKRITILATVTALSLAAGACTTSPGQAVEHHPATTTLSPRPPILVVDGDVTPSGWVPVDLGDAQISVPSGWKVGYDTCKFSAPPGSVQISIPHDMVCPSGPGVFNRFPAVYLVSTLTSFGPVVVVRKTINGIVVLETHSGAPESSYVVPSLDISLDLVGAAAQRVIATLTYSPRAIVLSGKPAPTVPSSWHWFSFAGLSFAAPSSWPRESTDSDGPFCATPGSPAVLAVTLSSDTQALGGLGCAAAPPPLTAPSDGVRVDANPVRAELPFPPLPSLASHCLDVHGLSACPYTEPAFGILYLRVSGRRMPHAVMFELGLAGSGPTALTILGSLRPA
jgi:hypothetical protein